MKSLQNRKGRMDRPLVKQFGWLNLLFVLLLQLAISQRGAAQSLDCKTGCTSNDVQIQEAYLVDPVTGTRFPSTFRCNNGEGVRVKLALELTTKTPRYGVYIFANLKDANGNIIKWVDQNNQTIEGVVSECFSTKLSTSTPTTKVIFDKELIWNCGTVVNLTDVFIGWGTGNADFCESSSAPRCPGTPSKCFSLPPGNYIPIVIPSATTASDTKCASSPGGNTATFDLTTLEATIKGGQTNVTVSWYLNPDLTNAITNKTAFTTQTTTVYAKVTNNTNTTAFNKVDVTLTVNQSAVVAAGTNLFACQSQAAQEVALTGARVSGGASSGTWSVVSSLPEANIGLSNNTLANGSVTIPANYIGVITLKLTSLDPDGTGPCTTASATRTVTVNKTPTATVASDAKCATSANVNTATFNLTDYLATVKNGQTDVTVTWFKDAGLKAADEITGNAITAYTVTGSATVYAKVANANALGCYSSAAVSLTVNTTPAAPSNPNDQIVCQTSASQTLTASATVPDDGTVIVWYDASTGGKVVTSPELKAVGTITYYAEAVKGTCRSLSRTPVTLTINEAPDAPTNPNHQTVCQTSPLQTLTASATVKSGESIVWYSSETSTAAVTPTLSVVGTTTYWAAAKNNTTGCFSLARTAVTLTIKPTPGKPTVTATKQPTCADPSGAVAVSSANADYTYTLTGPTTKTPNSTGVFSGLAPGNYTVTATLNGCLSVASDAVTINAIPTAPASPTVSVTEPKLCGPATGTVTITCPLNPETGPAIYEYQNGSGNWQTSPVFANIAAGAGFSIKVRRISDPTCISGATTCQVPGTCAPAVATLSVTEQKVSQQVAKEDQLTAYPIPFSETTTLEFVAERDGNYEINLYDLKGKLIRKLKSGVAKAGEITQIEVDGRSMAEGMYLARMVNNNVSKTVKLLLKRK